jgi:hypothetical protein
MSSLPISREEAKAIVEDPSMMDGETMDILFQHYCNNGEMPYGVAKARTGDPDQWIYDRLVRELAN